MPWFVVHTKPRQEARALQNLERQGFCCFLPTLAKKKTTRQGLKVVQEPLFTRYLFIDLDTTLSGKSWAPIRSTLGVARLVTFGIEPAKVDARLIEFLKEQQSRQEAPPSPYREGDKVVIQSGPFAGLEAVYQMDDGERRAMVLIELIQKPTKLQIDITEIAPAAQ